MHCLVGQHLDALALGEQAPRELPKPLLQPHPVQGGAQGGSREAKGVARLEARVPAATPVAAPASGREAGRQEPREPVGTRVARQEQRPVQSDAVPGPCARAGRDAALQAQVQVDYASVEASVPGRAEPAPPLPPKRLPPARRGPRRAGPLRAPSPGTAATESAPRGTRLRASVPRPARPLVLPSLSGPVTPPPPGPRVARVWSGSGRRSWTADGRGRRWWRWRRRRRGARGRDACPGREGPAPA